MRFVDVEQLLREAEPIIMWSLWRVRRRFDEDLAQDLRLAMVRAAHRFDPDGPAKWTTYATLVARHEIANAFDRDHALKRGGLREHVSIDELRNIGLWDRDAAPVELHLFVLTASQRDVIDGVMRGEEMHETATRLGITVEAVKLRRKMAVERLRRAHGMLRCAQVKLGALAGGRIGKTGAREITKRRKLARPDPAHVVELYRAGHSARQVAEMLASSHPTVREILRQAGAEVRTRAAASENRWSKTRARRELEATAA